MTKDSFYVVDTVHPELETIHITGSNMPLGKSDRLMTLIPYDSMDAETWSRVREAVHSALMANWPTCPTCGDKYDQDVCPRCGYDGEDAHEIPAAYIFNGYEDIHCNMHGFKMSECCDPNIPNCPIVNKDLVFIDTEEMGEGHPLATLGHDIQEQSGHEGFTRIIYHGIPIQAITETWEGAEPPVYMDLPSFNRLRKLYPNCPIPLVGKSNLPPHWA